MKLIYQLIAQRIQQFISEILWIDLDNGQLDYNEYRAAIAMPAVLIDIAYPNADDMGHSGGQTCQVSIALRLISQSFSDTNISAPEEIRENGLKQYDMIERIQETLHQWQPDNNNVDVLLRQSVTKESRSDGLTVHRLMYTTQYYDENNALEPNTHYPVPPEFTQKP